MNKLKKIAIKRFFLFYFSLLLLFWFSFIRGFAQKLRFSTTKNFFLFFPLQFLILGFFLPLAIVVYTTSSSNRVRYSLTSTPATFCLQLRTNILGSFSHITVTVFLIYSSNDSYSSFQFLLYFKIKELNVLIYAKCYYVLRYSLLEQILLKFGKFQY